MTATMPKMILNFPAPAVKSEPIIGAKGGLRQACDDVRMVAPTDATVLIHGETGTGKELIARAIHNQSPRCHGPYVKVNCAAIPAELLESELFGHERGAFTGALTQTTGRFHLADGGTLFLDEVGDLPLALQPKLLRVLQEQEFERLGSTRTIRVNVRVVAATNRDLMEMVREGWFRADLFYRLNVFPISLPPLRERCEDMADLVWHFAQKFAARMNRNIEVIPDEVMEALQAYDWPGNVRELQNLIERAVILCEGETLSIVEPWPQAETLRRSQPAVALAETLASQEKKIIEAALKESRGRISGRLGAAGKLGLSRTTLDSKIKNLRINKHQYKAV